MAVNVLMATILIVVCGAMAYHAAKDYDALKERVKVLETNSGPVLNRQP